MSAVKEKADRPILVAVDFSTDSEHALLWASRQADLERAPLLVLHVVHDPAASPGFYHKPDDHWLRPMIVAAEKMMADFLSRIRSEHPDLIALQRATTSLVNGLPGGRIVEIAQNSDARLVVMGSRGLSRLKSIMLGSVADRVARTCPVPVVVVKTPGAHSSE